MPFRCQDVPDGIDRLLRVKLLEMVDRLILPMDEIFLQIIGDPNLPSHVKNFLSFLFDIPLFYPFVNSLRDCGFQTAHLGLKSAKKRGSDFMKHPEIKCFQKQSFYVTFEQKPF